MRVRMIASISGTVDGYDLPPRGGEIDLPDHVAAALCDAGQASPLATEDEVETAAVDQANDVEERAEPAEPKVDRRARAKAVKESSE